MIVQDARLERAFSAGIICGHCMMLRERARILGKKFNTYSEELEATRKQLENCREQRIKGNMIRSRAQLSKDLENPYKYFLSLEKRNL